MRINYFLRNDVLHEVTEIVAEHRATVTIKGSMGTVTVRKNGRDGKLYRRPPFGWGRLCNGKKRS